MAGEINLALDPLGRAAAPETELAPAPELSTRRFARAPGASGHRLLRSFEVLEHFPALEHTRDRLLALLAAEKVDLSAVVSAVESDAALAIAVLRRTGRVQEVSPLPASIPAAVSALAREELRDVVAHVPTFGFFQAGEQLRAVAERYRLHAVATQLLSEQIRRAAGAARGDELALTALLHDIGKLPLLYAYERYEELSRMPGTPEQRVALERRYTGIDHALAGGVLSRRLGLPERVARAIERHHAEDATSDTAIVRLADMLAHYSAGQPVDKQAMLQVAATLGLDARRLDSLLAELPGAAHARIPQVTPSPLSKRQTEILRLLARGKLYKEIGLDLGLSPSTIRTHLHGAYKALGVPDRAQAVLRSTEQGWL